MRLFRSHIFRLSFTLALMVSIAAHYMQPVNKSTKYSAFTSWLSLHLKNRGDEAVKKQIRELGNTSEALEAVIRNASVFVKTNADNFELDFEKADQNEIFRYLLTEWISFVESQQGMAKGVVVSTAKAGTIYQNDNNNIFTGSVPPPVYSALTAQYPSLNVSTESLSGTTKEPLPFGIAIGAP